MSYSKSSNIRLLLPLLLFAILMVICAADQTTNAFFQPQIDEFNKKGVFSELIIKKSYRTVTNSAIYLDRNAVHSEPSDTVLYYQLRNGLQNSLIKFEHGKKARVAFIGGSITYNPGWRDSISVYFQNRFPHTNFDFIAAGIPSMGSTPAAFRLQRDVLSKGPVDLVFMEAAVNDATNGRTSEEQLLAMEGVVRHIRADNPVADIIFMYFVDPEKMDIYRKGNIPPVIKNHEKVASHYGIPALNLAREVTERIDAGEFSWKKDFKNLHPSPFGQQLYFRSIKAMLEEAWNHSISDDEKIEHHFLPPPLDHRNYDKGTLIPAAEANIKKGNGWNIVEHWKPEDKVSTRSNYVDVTMLVSETPGSNLEYRFSGNTVGITVAAGPDAGTVEYRIDRGPWKQQDLFTRWSKSLHLPWYHTLAVGLESGKHVLELRLITKSNAQSTGSACRIRYFFVNR